jgi:hypothetical protein
VFNTPGLPNAFSKVLGAHDFFDMTAPARFKSSCLMIINIPNISGIASAQYPLRAFFRDLGMFRKWMIGG